SGAAQTTLARAWNPAKLPVPSENVHRPRFVVLSSVQRPTALLPPPASSTTLLSSRPSGMPRAWSYKILELTLIAGRFEDVIVQKSPALPLYCEHSLMTWRSRVRSEDADAETAPVVRPSATSTVTTLNFTDVSS